MQPWNIQNKVVGLGQHDKKNDSSTEPLIPIIGHKTMPNMISQDC